jgi:hypothetical protein
MPDVPRNVLHAGAIEGVARTANAMLLAGDALISILNRFSTSPLKRGGSFLRKASKWKRKDSVTI